MKRCKQRFSAVTCHWQQEKWPAGADCDYCCLQDEQLDAVLRVLRCSCLSLESSQKEVPQFLLHCRRHAVIIVYWQVWRHHRLPFTHRLCLRDKHRSWRLSSLFYLKMEILAALFLPLKVRIQVTTRSLENGLMWNTGVILWYSFIWIEKICQGSK